MAATFVFKQFELDSAERQLRAGDRPVELSSRYFDALSLLVREQGRLVTKDRFLDEVWRGVPVTDEALTQCVKTLRRILGDDAARPRFIETVPKHGYRFIAPVEGVEFSSSGSVSSNRPWRKFLIAVVAGIAGGGVAGLIGGLIYGFAVTSEAEQQGSAISTLLVLASLTTLAAVLGSAGVSLGVATARFARPGSISWAILGGGIGGMFVGAFVKLLGLDAFNLLVGQSPGNITGGSEGLVIGAAVGLGAGLAARARSKRGGILVSALCGGVTGFALSVAGGRLMFGSLDLLQRHLDGSHLHLGRVSAIFGEAVPGPVTLASTAILEGSLFAGCVVGAMLIAGKLRRLDG